MSLLKNLFGSKQVTPPSLSQDIEHINQEMYKKSAELAERNKTLSLLHKLDAIILGSITHLNEIAQLVTSLLVKDGNFDSVFIYIVDKQTKTLQRLSFSETSKAIHIPYFTSVPLTQTENIIVQSVNEQTRKFAPTAENILLPSSDFAKPDVQQALANVKLVQLFPLVVRNEVLGVLVISLFENEQSLSEYRRDLLVRLADTIGIAIDNSILYNEVQSANERLKQLDKIKDEFVAVASHELRTPMTAIKSYLWMTLEGRGGPISEKQKHYLQGAYTSVDRLIRLVSDMLNVSRIDAGRVSLELGIVDLEKVVQEVFEEVTPRAQEFGVALIVSPVQNLPPVVADFNKIKEVFFNIVGNALKFTPKGGMITVSFVQKDNMIETTIADTGTGIDSVNLPKLFQKFSMITDSYISDRSIQGTGLGLYISKFLVDLHGGRIWATSEGHGKGTQFVFSLKAATPQDIQTYTSKPSNEQKPVENIIHTTV
jgi:two-component system, sensor histidine kinase and response regulator